MSYDFETMVPAFGDDSPMRRNLRAGGFAEDVIDYGVAEMKFPLFPDMKKAIIDLVSKDVLGYSAGTKEYFEAVCKWMETRHEWHTEPQWISQTYGVVEAIGIAIRAFTNPGDKILIQNPVYNPFTSQIETNGRIVIDNPLVFINGRYEIDFADFELKAKQADMFILCSPHNPVGRVWTKEDLQKMAEICVENNVLVLSDEIHSDIVFEGIHTAYGAINEKAADNCIVCTAPSKTFNIPGLITSNIIIKNEELRNAFIKERDTSIGHYINPIGCAACRAAYEKGAAWVDEMCAYIKGNTELLEKLLAEKVPQAKMAKMDGTYIAWIDLNFLGLEEKEFEQFITKTAGLPVNMGARYGKAGEGFIRVNIGCPRRYVKQFADILSKAINER